MIPIGIKSHCLVDTQVDIILTYSILCNYLIDVIVDIILTYSILCNYLIDVIVDEGLVLIAEIDRKLFSEKVEFD